MALEAPTVAVVILTMNQRDKTLRCLMSFRSVTIPSFNIVLWDNGSHDGTAEVVRERFPEVLVHHHHSNLGVASGRNAAATLAIKSFNPSHLLFIDNDTIVAPNFLQALLEPFMNDEALAQTAPKIRLLNDPDRLDEAGGSKIQFWLGRIKVIGYGEIDVGQHNRRVPCIAGGVMLVRTNIFQHLGGFDTRFDPYGPEDMDFSLRVYKAGYYALYVPESTIFHDRTQTFEGGKYTAKFVRNKVRNWMLFMWKHASPLEKLGFVVVGMPYAITRAIIREGRKGNLGALRGFVQGMLDLSKSSIGTRE